MNHLTLEQLDQALAGEGSPETTQHLLACTKCTAELASLGATLGDFRAAATTTAENQRRSAVLPAARPTRPGIWASAAALLLFTVSAAPLLIHHGAAPQPGPVAPVVESVSDEALLSSIQNDLSTTVPAPLKPLALPSTSNDTQRTNQ